MYHFYIGGDLLPYAPDSIRIRVNSTNEVVNLVSMGDYNVLKDIGLRDFDFDVLLPGKPLPGVLTADNFRLPIYYLVKFRDYKEAAEPVRLIITRTMQTGADIFTTNILVGFEDYSVIEEAGYEGDVEVRLKFREHRDPKVIKSEVVSISTQTAPNGQPQTIAEVVHEEQRPSPPTDREYTVVRGDTLWAIAARKLGNGSRYMEIARLNNIQNPNLIFPGQVLRLP